MRQFLIIASAMIILGFITVFAYTCNTVKEHITDNAFESYEEFQEIYNTCAQINDNLCSVESISPTDKMFEQFSKEQRIVGMRQQMNRWIQEYNAKSKMWNRAMWKSKALPYQLNTSDFKCY